MKKLISSLMILTVVAVLAGCASNNLNAPCPNFGGTCDKTPINSWNYTK